MDLAEMQAEVDRWVGQFEDGYWPPLANLARLAEEVGELARLLNHLHGPKRKKGIEDEQELALELGDILFVLAVLANQHDLDLSDAFRRTLAKYGERDAGRWVRHRDEGAERG